MAFFTTQITDDVMLLLECETSGAFTKSDLEIKPNPMMAFLNSVDAITTVSKAMADSIAPAMRSSGCEVDVQFGVKVDGNGSILLAKETDQCQFQVTIRFRDGG